VVAMQLACNCCAGGGPAGDTVWRGVFPGAASAVAALRGAAAHRAHPPLCMLMHARVVNGSSGSGGGGEGDGHVDAGHDTNDAWSLCGFAAGAAVWEPLLAAASDPAQLPGAGGGEWLPRLVAAACLFRGEALPPLCRSLGPDAAAVAAARDIALRAKILDTDDNVDAIDDATTEKFSTAQATLLALVGVEVVAAPSVDPRGVHTRAAADAPPDSGGGGPSRSAPDEPPALVLSEGTLAFLLDLTSRAAAATQLAATEHTPLPRDSTNSDTTAASGPSAVAPDWPDNDELASAGQSQVTNAAGGITGHDDEDQALATKSVLMESLSLIRRLTEREVRPSLMQTPGDIVAVASTMGLPRLLLGLIAAMPPPRGAGQTSKATGPTAAPTLDPAAVTPPALRQGHAPYPATRPWEGYRVDCLAPLSNAMYNRPSVCDQVVRLGGVAVVLAATRGEDGDDYLREWALWAVRNLCAGSDAARAEIEGLQPQAAADAHQLAAMGLDVDVDASTGRVKVKKGGARGSAGERIAAGTQEGNVGGEAGPKPYTLHPKP